MYFKKQTFILEGVGAIIKFITKDGENTNGIHKHTKVRLEHKKQPPETNKQTKKHLKSDK